MYRGSETETKTIDSATLVVGDIVKFEQGMKIPADCIMVTGQDVQMSEGELTGESEECEKTVVIRENYTTNVQGTMFAKSLVL